MVEVLIEDLGYNELKKPVVKPLEGIKIAGQRAQERRAPVMRDVRRRKLRKPQPTWTTNREPQHA